MRAPSHRSRGIPQQPYRPQGIQQRSDARSVIYPEYIESIPAQGQWLNNSRPNVSLRNREFGEETRRPQVSLPNSEFGEETRARFQGSSNQRRSSALASADGTSARWNSTHATPPPEQNREENKRHTGAAREIHRPYLKEMAASHAQNHNPLIEIPVCPSVSIFGTKSPWHRAAQLCAF